MIRTGLILVLLIRLVNSQDFPIEDIPIESYDQTSRQENDMDLELLPRQHRSFDDTGPKPYFFSSLGQDDDDIKTYGPYANIPRPMSFITLYSNLKHEKSLNRRKRSDTEKEAESSTLVSKDPNDLIFSLGKPLEVANLEIESTTPLIEEKVEKREEENIVINDFIRFRRSSNDDLRNKSDSKNIIFDRSDDEINRDTRGITKDHWIRQAYPVRKWDEMAFEDNIPMSSENVRIPRVHFVGKVPEDSPLRAQFRPNAREARGFSDIPPPDQYIEPDYFRSRYVRPYYGMVRPEFPPRYDREPPLFRPTYENYEAPRSFNLGASRKPQKRIIYYATLPEISRPTPNIRDRYHYDKFDDRYFQDPYKFRKAGYQKSSRYEDGKTPFPVKVSTDVNVREVKKNPERRIYSEIERNRYAHSTPYQTAEG